MNNTISADDDDDEVDADDNTKTIHTAVGLNTTVHNFIPVFGGHYLHKYKKHTSINTLYKCPMPHEWASHVQRTTYNEHSEERVEERVEVVARDAVDLLGLRERHVRESAAKDLHAEQRADHEEQEEENEQRADGGDGVGERRDKIPQRVPVPEASSNRKLSLCCT